MKGEITKKELAEERLRAAGIGVTFQRLEIARALFARRQHLTAEQVLRAVNAHDLSASKATVYNTLRLFVDKGLLREVVIDSARIVYDSATVEHHHIFDIDTGELTDVMADDVVLSRLPEIPSNKSLESVNVVFRVRSRTRDRE